MTPTRVLIVDDEVKLVRSISFALQQAGIDCLLSYTGEQGIAVAEKQSPDLVLLDVKMPGASGLDVLVALKEFSPDLPVIMMSALDATQDAVRAVKLGAFDYLSKPFDMDDVIHLISQALAECNPVAADSRQENRKIDKTMLLGSSPVIDHLRSQLDRIIASEARCIMLQGEVGVGKAVIARELHRRTCGSEAPLVELNCATLATDRAEIELFGQLSAQTGGLPRRGLIEMADGGTLFLHEIEALPLPVQTRLNIFLETGSLQLVAKGAHKANVQVVVSTHYDLSDALQQNKLRHDLFLKLNALPLMVPPLRERGKDIELLALRFLHDVAQRAGKRQITLGRASLERLFAYAWPGNVRELKNLIERLTVLYPGATIEEGDLPAELRGLAIPQPQTIEDQMREVERDLVLEALAESQGRKGRAAEKLGISRHALKRRLHKLGLQ